MFDSLLHEKIKKVNSVSYEDAMKLIYGWVKEYHISLKQFNVLVFTTTKRMVGGE